MSAVIIDARDLFGDLQREARARRFKTELAAFERQYSDRARTFFDMYEAVAWARQHPESANYSILAMDDEDVNDQVCIARLAKTLYGAPRDQRII